MYKKRIWIDLVTAPDVPFFSSIIKECRRRGDFEIIITARKYLEVPELVRKYDLKPVVFIDCFYGKSIPGKIISLLFRVWQLFFFSIGKRISIAFSFASRSQTVAAWMAWIPVSNMIDYEGGEMKLINLFSKIVLVPKELPREYLRSQFLSHSKTMYYPDIKESAYAFDFSPDRQEIERAGVLIDSVVIVIRMNSTFAHYHSEKSIELDKHLINYLAALDNVCCIILPRYDAQRQLVQEISKKNPRVRLLKQPVNGQNLIWHSDGVISGGGSMIREAVCLGVPAYDIFDGRIGAVEKMLIDSGKVIKLNSPDDFSKIKIRKILETSKKREKSELLSFIVDTLGQIHSR
jgi:predicted glycosyltransferase